MLRNRLLLVFAVVLYVSCFFVGCKTVKEAYDSYKVCRENPVCFDEMERGRTLTESLTTAVAAGVPVPGVQGSSVAIGSSLGMLVSLLIGVFRGRKYKKKGGA